MTIYSLDILLSQFWTSPLFYVQFYFFLTCIQVSQDAVRWSGISISFNNFPQFVVIYTVKGFSIVSETEVDVFLKFSCFFYDPMDVGNFIPKSYLTLMLETYVYAFVYICVHVGGSGLADLTFCLFSAAGWWTVMHTVGFTTHTQSQLDFIQLSWHSVGHA